MVEELDAALRAVLVDGLAGRRVVVPISGGLDSRLLAGALHESQAGDGQRAFTYGYAVDSVETRIGAGVAEAIGLPCRSLVVGPYLLDQLDVVVDALEGFQGLSSARQAGVAGQLAGMGDRVLGGHWGDVWLGSAGALGAAGAAGAAGPGDRGWLAGVARSKFAKRGSDWLVRHLCSPHLDRDAEVVLAELIQAEADRIPRLGDAEMELKALKTETWSFRWTLASVRAYQLGAFPVLPFYDPRLVDVLLTVPSQLHAGRALQIDWIRRCYPALARVAWQETGRDLSGGPPPPVAVDLAARAWRKAGRALRGERVVERNWEIQLHPRAQLQRLRHLVENGPVATMVPAGELSSLLDRFGSTVDPATGYTVDMLVTVAEWLRRHG